MKHVIGALQSMTKTVQDRHLGEAGLFVHDGQGWKGEGVALYD